MGIEKLARLGYTVSAGSWIDFEKARFFIFSVEENGHGMYTSSKGSIQYNAHLLIVAETNKPKVWSNNPEDFNGILA